MSQPDDSQLDNRTLTHCPDMATSLRKDDPYRTLKTAKHTEKIVKPASTSTTNTDLATTNPTNINVPLLTTTNAEGIARNPGVTNRMAMAMGRAQKRPLPESDTETSDDDIIHATPAAMAEYTNKRRKNATRGNGRGLGRSDSLTNLEGLTRRNFDRLYALVEGLKQKLQKQQEKCNEDAHSHATKLEAFQREARGELSHILTQCNKNFQEGEAKDIQRMRDMTDLSKERTEHVAADFKHLQADYQTLRTWLERNLSRNNKAVRELSSKQEYAVMELTVLIKSIAGRRTQIETGEILTQIADVENQTDGKPEHVGRPSDQTTAFPSEMYATEASTSSDRRQTHDPVSPALGSKHQLSISSVTGISQPDRSAATNFQPHYSQTSDGEHDQFIGSLVTGIESLEEEKAVLCEQVQSLEDVNSDIRQRLERLETFMTSSQNGSPHGDGTTAEAPVRYLSADDHLDVHDCALPPSGSESASAASVDLASHQYNTTGNESPEDRHATLNSTVSDGENVPLHWRRPHSHDDSDDDRYNRFIARLGASLRAPRDY